MLVGTITFLYFFAVLDVSFAVNSCLNRGFFIYCLYIRYIISCPIVALAMLKLRSYFKNLRHCKYFDTR